MCIRKKAKNAKEALFKQLYGVKPNVNKLRIKEGKKEADYKPGGNKMLKKTYHSGKEQRK